MVIKVSKIEELLKNEKVEWKKLGEICEIKKGKQYNKKDMLEIAEYPVINGGVSPSGYIEIFNENENTITVSQGGASAGFVNFIETKFWLGAHAFSIKPKIKIINDFGYNYKFFNRYIFHILKMNQYMLQSSQLGAGIPSLSKEKLSAIAIPMTTKESQDKIVKILDKFTNYVTELQAELQARNKQYSYYRDLFLSEDYLNKLSMKFELTNFQVKCQNLEDITYITSGGDIPKESYSNVRTEKFNIPIISNGVGENAIYGFTDKAKINEDAVTISARGTIGYAQYRNYPFYPIVRLLSLMVKDKSNVNIKYLYYLMQDKKYNLPPTGIPQLTIPMLKKIKVILPSIYIQNKVVEVLDRFQELIENSRGLLPEEIEKRQKQYEYYRKKLLTFDENMIREREREHIFLTHI